MDFEYDPEKSKSNKPKHGLDFETAQMLWQDCDRLVFPAQSESEPRWALLGLLDEKVWVAFYTIRGSAIRLISGRRARHNEEQKYHEC